MSKKGADKVGADKKEKKMRNGKDKKRIKIKHEDRQAWNQ